MSSPDTVFDHLYETALDRARLPELMRAWDRSLTERDPDGFATLPDAERLPAHVERAIRVMSLARTAADATGDDIDTDAQPVLIVDRDWIVTRCNVAARELLGCAVGRPFSELPFDDDLPDALTHALDAVYRAQGDASGASRHAAFDIPAFDLRLVELDSAENPIVLSTQRREARSGGKELVLRLCDYFWSDATRAYLAETLELTPAEVDVMSWLARGRSNANIAQMRDTTAETLRAQLRSLRSKLSVASRGDLVRIAVSLSGVDRLSPPLMAAASGTESDRTDLLAPRGGLLTLSGGRLLDYQEVGDPKGLPCVYFHNDFFGRSLTRAARHALHQAGLRLILPARPFYGRTSPVGAQVSNCEVTRRDVLTLADHLGLGRLTLVGQSISMLYAYHLAESDPDRVRAIVGVAPLLPFAKPEHERGLPPLQRTLAQIAKRYPVALRFLARAGRDYHKRIGSDAFLRFILRHSAADLAALEDPEVRACLMKGIVFSSACEEGGFLFDYRDAPANMKRRLDGVLCPITVLIGSQDGNNRLARARHAKATGTDITIHTVQGAGDLMLYTHPGVVVDRLSKAARAR